MTLSYGLRSMLMRFFKWSAQNSEQRLVDADQNYKSSSREWRSTKNRKYSNSNHFRKCSNKFARNKFYPWFLQLQFFYSPFQVTMDPIILLVSYHILQTQKGRLSLKQHRIKLHHAQKMATICFFLRSGEHKRDLQQLASRQIIFFLQNADRRRRKKAIISGSFFFFG